MGFLPKPNHQNFKIFSELKNFVRLKKHQINFETTGIYELNQLAKEILLIGRR